MQISEAIDLVLFLLNDKCSSIDRGKICSLLKLQCLQCSGNLPLPLLVFYVASLILNQQAIRYANLGKVKIDVLEIDYTKQSSELRQIAKELKQHADNCKQLLVEPAMIVSMVEHCIKPIELYLNSCGCTIPIKPTIINHCAFECCTDCEPVQEV